MKQRHTKEPWVFDKYNNVNDSQGRAIMVQGFALNACNETLDNSQRIVACVNASQGLTNEQLESGYIQSIINENKEFKAKLKEMESQLFHMDNLVSRFQDERYELQQKIDSGIRVRTCSGIDSIPDRIVAYPVVDGYCNATLILDDGVEL